MTNDREREHGFHGARVRHFKDAELASLIMSIGMINMWNRLNVATRQVSGEWTVQLVA